ncbi:MAG: NAD-dependent 4,6-dehydratase LegB [Bacteroidales bacterium]|jgi:NAD dependent epimerase/dehydratase|nr:NAD-dependent 4,6-dehydratase LegB [Bacteroidales bacterium]
MKKVLVTGADGFIGSHLVEHLLGDGREVVALACYNSFGSWGWLDNISVSPKLKVVMGDIRDSAFCRTLTEEVDIIFHLAALIAIPYSYYAPDSYVDTNIRGTLNICQAARDAGNIRVIHTSTSEVYGTAQYVPIDEKHPRQPQSPYAASKIGADALAMSFYHSFGLPVTIARPFNTYGPRQSARAVIPSVISQIAAGKKEIAAGDLKPARDFNFVNDVCRAFLALAANEGTTGREVNIASNTEISIADLVTLIAGLMKADITVRKEDARMRPPSSEVYRLRGDNTLIRELTGWQPQHSLEDGLRKTIDWFIKPENLSRYKPGIFNL